VRITAATNKVESYNGFAHWLAFGNNGVLADNDPAEQEKLIKLNTLLANLVIFRNALDIMDVVRKLAAEGWLITAEQLGAMSPYLRGHISRLGAYSTDGLARQPEAFDPVLKEVDFTRARPYRMSGLPGLISQRTPSPMLSRQLRRRLLPSVGAMGRARRVQPEERPPTMRSPAIPSSA
jgi:hypothetical protein